MKPIPSTQAPAAPGPSVQGVVAGGFLFASGQIALDPQTGELVGKTVEEQSEQVMRNMGAILESAGIGFDQVVKTTCFLDDMGDFAAFNNVYARSFGDHLPARSAVAVERLPKGALVEVEFIAKVGE